ncbi:MAG: HD domain-containing protein [Fibrobacterota bacterium]
MKKLYGIVDVGTRGVRLSVFEYEPKGDLSTLDILEQFIPLGFDLFSRKKKVSDTVNHEIIRVIREYKKVLDEYDIPQKNRIFLASPALKEAPNRDIFIDKITIATEVHLHILSDREITKYLYLSYKKNTRLHSSFQKKNILLYHIGGGDTPLIHIRHDRVTFSHISHFGTMRAFEELEDYALDKKELEESLYQEIERRIENTFSHGDITAATDELVTYGNSIAVAAHCIGNKQPDSPFCFINADDLYTLVTDIRSRSVSEIADAYDLPHATAKYLAPNLWTYALIAKKLGLKHITTARISLYDGIILFTEKQLLDLKEQTKKAALTLGEKYQFDKEHALRTARYSRHIYSVLAPEFGLFEDDEHLLILAAYLHDIGKFISGSRHHKHSAYLIRQSNLFGLTKADIELVALIAKYHRSKYPTQISEQKVIPHQKRILIMKLSAILRIADSLDKGYIHDKDIQVYLTNSALIIQMPYYEGLYLERLAIRENNRKFKDIYGITIELKTDSKDI